MQVHQQEQEGEDVSARYGQGESDSEVHVGSTPLSYFISAIETLVLEQGMEMELLEVSRGVGE